MVAQITQLIPFILKQEQAIRTVSNAGYRDQTTHLLYMHNTKFYLSMNCSSTRKSSLCITTCSESCPYPSLKLRCKKEKECSVVEFLCTGPETHIMYFLYGAVDFLNVLKKVCWVGVMCYWYIMKYIMYL
jgi:hypothetical protein